MYIVFWKTKKTCSCFCINQINDLIMHSPNVTVVLRFWWSNATQIKICVFYCNRDYLYLFVAWLGNVSHIFVSHFCDIPTNYHSAFFQFWYKKTSRNMYSWMFGEFMNTFCFFWNYITSIDRNILLSSQNFMLAPIGREDHFFSDES